MRNLVKFVMNETMPSHDGMPGVADIQADLFLDDFGKHAHLLMRIGFRLAVLVYVFCPIFTIGVPLPANVLSKEKREAHLQAYSSSRSFLLSQTWLLIKMITGMCWGMSPEVRAYFGYQPYDPELGGFREGDKL